MRFVSYLRVSTDRQGRSGLGLEAQRKTVQDYVNGKGRIELEFVEVESGKKNDRPALNAALVESKRLGATLLIAKLDRLARNVAFIANLLESGVEIAAADMPEANRFLLHVMAAVAEHEAKAISERTKAALAASKARGKKLGWSNPTRHVEQQNAAASGAARTAELANERANNLIPLVSNLAKTGLSLRSIATELNRMNVATARGGKWHATTVANVIARSFTS